MSIRIIEFATGFQTDETPGSSVDASTIAVTPSGDLGSTNVQAALVELQGDIDTLEAGVAAHLTDPTDAHDASAISSVPSGNLSASDVQTALNELQSDIDTRATAAALTAHTADTANPHGVTKTQVGLGNVDNTSDATKNAAVAVVTNKDIDGGTASNTSRITVPKGTLAALTALTRKEGTIVYATDMGAYYADNGSTLVAIPTGTPLTNPMTTSGDIIYGAGSGAATRLAANSTATKKWLRSLSSGTPTWEEVDQVKGKTDGVAVTAGYIGQKIAGSLNATVAISTGVTYNAATLALTAGVWQIYAIGTVTTASGGQATDVLCCIGDTNTDLNAKARIRFAAAVANASVSGLVTRYVNISSSTTYYLNLRATFGGVAEYTESTSDFYAVRVG